MDGGVTLLLSWWKDGVGEGTDNVRGREAQ